MFNKRKNLFFVALLCTFIAALALNGTAPVNAASATVYLTATKQTIKGFGGINHPVWISDLTESQRTTAFGNDAGQIGMSILRIHVDENSSNWSKEIATAQRAVALGAIVFASPWNPPSSMTETVNGQKRLRYDQYGAYTNHLNSFYNYMKQNGVDLYAISVQNEPDYANDWTGWTQAEMLNFMKANAGSLQTRVIAPESFQYIKSISDPILNDSQALANLDILGAHLYGTAVSNYPYPLFKQKGQGKELWMTEHYTDSTTDANAWPNALNVAYEIHNSMVEAEFNAYVWWYIRRSYGMITEGGTVSKRGYCMAQFSKFIRPGYVRVDATKNPQSNVYVSAYKSNQNVVVVVVNQSTSTQSVSLAMSGATVGSLTKYTTSGSKSLTNDGTISGSGGSFTLSLDPSSVTTFVGSLGTTTGTPTPTRQGVTPTPTQRVNTPTPTIPGTVKQCEDMTLAGTAAKITSPFSGVVLKANNDACYYTQYFANSTHRFTVRGCSSTSGAAKVELRIGGTTKGTFTFTGTSPTSQTLSNITHGTGNQEIRLVITSDDGTWDAIIDYLQIQ